MASSTSRITENSNNEETNSATSHGPATSFDMTLNQYRLINNLPEVNTAKQLMDERRQTMEKNNAKLKELGVAATIIALREGASTVPTRSRGTKKRKENDNDDEYIPSNDDKTDSIEDNSPSPSHSPAHESRVRRKRHDVPSVSHIRQYRRKETAPAPPPKKAKKSGVIVSKYPITEIRNSPGKIVEALKILSKEQNEWIIATGLGVLLDYKLTGLPHRIGYNVVKNYNHIEDIVTLDNGNSFSVTEDDVERTMGLPRGPINIVLNCDDYTERARVWREQFRNDVVNPWKISPTRVLDKIKACGGQVTDRFKENFIILLSTVLIAPFTNNYVNQQLLASDINFDDCSQYNWCEFLLKHLKKSRSAWKGTLHNFFCGSLTFLILLYVDRVFVQGGVDVERHSPVYKTWTTKLLMERENFEMQNQLIGMGTVRDIFVPSVQQQQPQQQQHKQLQQLQQPQPEQHEEHELQQQQHDQQQQHEQLQQHDYQACVPDGEEMAHEETDVHLNIGEEMDFMHTLEMSVAAVMEALAKYNENYTVCTSIQINSERVTIIDNSITELCRMQINRGKETANSPIAAAAQTQPLSPTQSPQPSSPTQYPPPDTDSITYSQYEALSQTLHIYHCENNPATTDPTNPKSPGPTTQVNIKSPSNEPVIPHDHQTPLLSSMEFNSEDLNQCDTLVELVIEKRSAAPPTAETNDQIFEVVDVMGIAKEAVGSLHDESEQQDEGKQQLEDVEEEEDDEEQTDKIQVGQKIRSTPTFDLGISPLAEQSSPTEQLIVKKRRSKPAKTLKSPYKQRVVDLDANISVEEVLIYNWIEGGAPPKDV